VDPYYLSWKAREYDFYTKFIELAAEVNSSMPFFTVNRIAEALNRQGKPLLGARILVLGAAFKRDIDDPRNAPALEVMKALLARGAEVSYHDPYVPEVSLDAGAVPARRLASVPLAESTLAVQDCVCLAVAHSAFDIPWLIEHSRLLMDATGVTRRFPQDRGTVIRL
jgi:UDP-N-acetyl-D-glucosamine dehydrogenase